MPSSEEPRSETRGLLCQSCFKDPGIRLMCRGETAVVGTCPNCHAEGQHLINSDQLLELCYQFFVRGSQQRLEYGAAPRIQFNDLHPGDLNLGGQLQHDIALLETTLGIGFFEYGPRLWMVGEIEPLKDLQNPKTRPEINQRIVDEFPALEISPADEFFRVRKAPKRPADRSEYDAPPTGVFGSGRLESANLPIMYASQELEICVHECRFAAGDELYGATMRPLKNLRLLDLTAILDEDVTEFESLDLAVNMVFLAGPHSYPISRGIAETAKASGYDGLVYPSFFSLLRTGGRPFETAYGLSLRRYGDRDYERSKIIPNLALFGRPLESGLIDVLGINRIEITTARYGITLGPVF